MYGKIINNEIKFANIGSFNIDAGDCFIWGKASESDLLKAGFVKLIPTENPLEKKEGFTYNYTWEIQEDRIVCVWKEFEVTDEQFA